MTKADGPLLHPGRQLLPDPPLRGGCLQRAADHNFPLKLVGLQDIQRNTFSMLEKHLDAVTTGFGQSDIDNQRGSTNLGAHCGDRPDVGFVCLLGSLSVSSDQLCRTRAVDNQPEREELSAF